MRMLIGIWLIGLGLALLGWHAVDDPAVWAKVAVGFGYTIMGMAIGWGSAA